MPQLPFEVIDCPDLACAEVDVDGARAKTISIRVDRKPHNNAVGGQIRDEPLGYVIGSRPRRKPDFSVGSTEKSADELARRIDVRDRDDGETRVAAILEQCKTLRGAD